MTTFIVLNLLSTAAAGLFWALIAHQGYRVSRTQWTTAAIPVVNTVIALVLLGWLAHRRWGGDNFVR